MVGTRSDNYEGGGIGKPDWNGSGESKKRRSQTPGSHPCAKKLRSIHLVKI